MPRFLVFWALAAFSIIGFIAIYLYGGESTLDFKGNSTELSNEVNPNPQDWLAQTIQEHGNEQIDVNVLDPCSIAASLGNSAQISQCGPSQPEE